GQANPHRPATEQCEEPEVALDYGFMGMNITKEDENMVAPMIFGKDAKTASYAASAVHRKGASKYAVAYIVGFIKGLGYKKVVLRSDSEKSILKLIELVNQHLPSVEIIPKASPEGDRQANGMAEAAVREIKGQYRTLRNDLESKYGYIMEESSPILTWIPRRAANVINRYR
ncbi:unnamed protein product, partial [Prorocentrum cordatum]